MKTIRRNAPHNTIDLSLICKFCFSSMTKHIYAAQSTKYSLSYHPNFLFGISKNKTKVARPDGRKNLIKKRIGLRSVGYFNRLDSWLLIVHTWFAIFLSPFIYFFCSTCSRHFDGCFLFSCVPKKLRCFFLLIRKVDGKAKGFSRDDGDCFFSFVSCSMIWHIGNMIWVGKEKVLLHWLYLEWHFKELPFFGHGREEKRLRQMQTKTPVPNDFFSFGGEKIDKYLIIII